MDEANESRDNRRILVDHVVIFDEIIFRNERCDGEGILSIR